MDWQADRIGAAERGENPTVLTRLRTGWAVIGDIQHLPGYCLLLYAGEANHLTDLPRDERRDFLFDLSLLGEAVSTVCQRRDPKFLRVNYEILGNLWPHLHGHVHARYEWEPARYRVGPVSRYPDRNRAANVLGIEHTPLKTALTAELLHLMSEYY